MDIRPKPSSHTNPAPQPPQQKRKKTPAACLTCQKKKRKCDGARPHCQSCAKEGVETCTYLKGLQERYDDLWAENNTLKEQVASQKVENEKLHANLRRSVPNSSTSSAGDSANPSLYQALNTQQQDTVGADHMAFSGNDVWNDVNVQYGFLDEYHGAPNTYLQAPVQPPPSRPAMNMPPHLLPSQSRGYLGAPRLNPFAAYTAPYHTFEEQSYSSAILNLRQESSGASSAGRSDAQSAQSGRHGNSRNTER